MKKIKPNKIKIEFDGDHLPVLVAALETYSRLQSGQVSIAMDTVYADRNLSWDEREHIEGTIRYMAFPANPRREYDGDGGFYDQYNNEYDENGNVVEECEEWKTKKNRPHLDYTNSYFGVGCPEMKSGTIAWEIKKTIDQYLHYQRNEGYRDIGVDGDGPMKFSDTELPKILDPIFGYWKPQKAFRIPQRYQERTDKAIKEKQFSKAWDIVNKAFEKNPLPKGKTSKIEEIADTYYVVIEEPYIV